MNFSKAATLALAMALSAQAAWSQAYFSTADTGSYNNNSGNKTGSQVGEQWDQAQVGTQHDNWTYAESMQRNFSEAPDTLTTRTQGYLQSDQNNFGLGRVSTELMAPFSVNNGSVPSGSFNLGFGAGKAQPYVGPFRMTGAFGGRLPAVSTGSVDLDVTSGAGGFYLGGPDSSSAARDFLDFSRNAGFNGQGGVGDVDY